MIEREAIEMASRDVNLPSQMQIARPELDVGRCLSGITLIMSALEYIVQLSGRFCSSRPNSSWMMETSDGMRIDEETMSLEVDDFGRKHAALRRPPPLRAPVCLYNQSPLRWMHAPVL